MKEKIIKFIVRRFLHTIVFLIFLLGIFYFWSPTRFTNTIRFFPNYNPFTQKLIDTVPNLSQFQNLNVPSEKSEIIKFNLPTNTGENRDVLVYLPKGYNSQNESQRYPVIYLLHGIPGTESEWLEEGGAQQTLDQLIDNKTIPPTLAVFPDGSGGINRDTQFINSADGKELDEDYLVKTVVNYVDKNFLTRPESQWRAIGGISSGGFGALNLGLKNQNVFGYILDLSGYGVIDQNYNSQRFIQGNSQVIKNNSPLEYIPNLSEKDVKISIIAGRQDRDYNDSQQVYDSLNAAGFQVDFLLFGGIHKWVFWRAHLPDGLTWLGKYWSGEK